jgi:rhodanese-related sulfurtransferase
VRVLTGRPPAAATVSGMSHPLTGSQLEVTTEDTARALADGSAQVIDVREDYEREAGHVAGTRHLVLSQVAANAESIDPERPVIFQCRVGGRSLMAAQAFRGAGFDAYSMAGGVQQWVDEGRPIAPDGGYVADH